MLGAVGLATSLATLAALLLVVGVVLFLVYRRPRLLINLLQTRLQPDPETPEMKIKVSTCDSR